MTHDVQRLRRYPVKSMGGEDLDAVEVGARGLAGDRWYAVVDDGGHLASGKNTRRFRRHDEVFAYAARTVGDRVEVVGRGGSWVVGDPALDRELTRAMGTPMRVRHETAVPHHDEGPVSLVGTATLDWVARELGADADPRRFRANVVVGTEEPFVEESWVGRDLRVGALVLRVVDRLSRCRMIDLAQDGAAQARVLKPLTATREMFLAVYAEVTSPGRVALGDPVEVEPA